MKLLIIRHGESEADILKVCEGWADFSLTPRGHKQAEAMSKYVSKHYHVDKIYTSSLKRACQTAQYLEKLTGLSAIKTDKLKEFNNGLRAVYHMMKHIKSIRKSSFQFMLHVMDKKVN